MAEKNGAENPKPKEKEGHNLLGKPKYKKLENGRLKCVQTGHELPAHAAEAYAQSKHCRLGLIDWALTRNKPPLNLFVQDPTTRSKLICTLTEDTINKTEEHIWKHMNGARFLKMLEKKETETEKETEKDEMEVVPEEEDKEKKKEKKDKKKKKKDKKKKKKKSAEKEKVDDITDEPRDPEGNGCDMEKEADFWMPPAGERWDHDDGGDRWASDSESGPESDNVGKEAEEIESVDAEVEEIESIDAPNEEVKNEAAKLSKKTKRMSLETEPSASKKKKQQKTKAV